MREGPESSSGPQPADSRSTAAGSMSPAAQDRRARGRAGRPRSRRAPASGSFVAQVDRDRVAERRVRAPSQVVAGGSPDRFALVVGERTRGARARRARADGPGMRTPIDAGSPPRSQRGALGARGSTIVSAPGQQAAASRSARSSSARDRPRLVDATRRAPAASGRAARCFASNSRAVAAAIVGPGADPVDRVGRQDDQLAASRGGRRPLRRDRRRSRPPRRHHAVAPVEVGVDPRVGRARRRRRPRRPSRPPLARSRRRPWPPGRSHGGRLGEQASVERGLAEQRQSSGSASTSGGSSSRASAGTYGGFAQRGRAASELGGHRREQIAVAARRRRGRARARSPAQAPPPRSRGRSRTTTAPGCSSAIAQRDRAGTGADVDDDAARRSPTTRARATSTSTSVSGRGTKTPGRTASTSRRNPCSPVRCCSGSPVQRRQSARP